MEEQLITFETAKLAKEKGFDLCTRHYFISTGELIDIEDLEDIYPKNWNNKWIYTKCGTGCFGCKIDNIKYFEACSAPTQFLLQKWLREKYKIDVVVIPYDNQPINYCSYLYKHLPDDKLDRTVLEKYPTYEEALEQGLIEGLNLIK